MATKKPVAKPFKLTDDMETLMISIETQLVAQEKTWSEANQVWRDTVKAIKVDLRFGDYILTKIKKGIIFDKIKAMLDKARKVVLPAEIALKKKTQEIKAIASVSISSIAELLKADPKKAEQLRKAMGW